MTFKFEKEKGEKYSQLEPFQLNGGLSGAQE